MFTAERSLVTGALTPERQVGLQLWGSPLADLAPKHKDMVAYSLGVFNGNGRNITANDNGNFMYAGRVVVTPFHDKLLDQDVKWSIGLDGLISTYGKGTRIGQTGNLAFNTTLGDGSLTGFMVPGSEAESRAWGVDQTLRFGPFDLIAEYLQEQVKPVNNAAFTPFTASGYWIEGAYSFNVCKRKAQVVAKWESFNPGQTANDGIQSITGGLNYYIKGDHLKLMLDYIHTWSDFRSANPALGQDQFNELIARAQLLF